MIHHMDISEVEYMDMQKRGGSDIITSIFVYQGSR